MFMFTYYWKRIVIFLQINVHVIDVNNVALTCCALQEPQTQHIHKKSKNSEKYTQIMTTVLFAIILPQEPLKQTADSKYCRRGA